MVIFVSLFNAKIQFLELIDLLAKKSEIQSLFKFYIVKI